MIRGVHQPLLDLLYRRIMSSHCHLPWNVSNKSFGPKNELPIHSNKGDHLPPPIDPFLSFSPPKASISTHPEVLWFLGVRCQIQMRSLTTPWCLPLSRVTRDDGRHEAATETVSTRRKASCRASSALPVLKSSSGAVGLTA